MKTIETVKVGDTIEIHNIDLMVKSFIKDKIFSVIDIAHLRVLCSVKEKTKYKVSDVCKNCRMLKIKLGKKNLPIKYNYIILVE